VNEFAAQLLRLKQALGLIEDQDVAQALGMSKAAFSDRKRRNAFPAEKLAALAASHPEWQLDLDYVLTGRSRQTDELSRRLDIVADAARRAFQIDGLTEQQRAQVQQAIFEAVMAATKRGEGVPQAHSPESAPPANSPPKPPQVAQTFHGKVGQVAGGKIVNKGPRKK
jgi:hypothetical protein